MRACAVVISSFSNNITARFPSYMIVLYDITEGIHDESRWVELETRVRLTRIGAFLSRVQLQRRFARGRYERT